MQKNTHNQTHRAISFDIEPYGAYKSYLPAIL